MKAVKEEAFETMLFRLQEISDILEKDETGLDESIRLYEEGIKLSEICYEKLRNAELKVTELKKVLDSKLESDE